jgi:hypothetical protein
MVLRKLFGRRNADAAPQDDADERREWPRVKVELEVRVRFASSEELVHSEVLNLSRGGALIVAEETRPIGTRARLVLTVGKRTVTIGGSVVHSTPRGEGIHAVGIMFMDIPERDRPYIDQLIEAQLALRER